MADNGNVTRVDLDVSSRLQSVNGLSLSKFYNNLRSTDSLLYGYQFVLEFEGDVFQDTVLKNIVVNNTTGEKISYLVQSTKVPNLDMSTGDTTFLGNTFHNPGVLKFPHNWDCTLLLLEDFDAYRIFRHWMNIMSNLRSSGGGDRVISNAKARVSVLDSSSQAKIRSFVLEGIWPSQIGSLALAYTQGGGNAATLQVTFQYQYWYRDDAFANADPLNAGNAREKIVRLMAVAKLRHRLTKQLTSVKLPGLYQVDIQFNRKPVNNDWLFVLY